VRGAWSFDETIAYLDDLAHEAIVPAAQTGLRRIELLLNELGHPERSFRSVHVTGSCGKGSTTTMIGSVLEAAGFRTGYFRSPHLESYRERIAVDGKDIAEEGWCRCFERVHPLVEQMRANAAGAYSYGRPSFSEILFAMACLHFRETGIEWAAVETGLGGRLDATNTLHPDVAAITNVNLEHTQILGESIREIAVEKAAIIKPSVHAVTASRDTEALHVIENRARAVGAKLLRLGDDVTVSVRHQGLTAQRIEFLCFGESLGATLPVAGGFQAQNAGVAVACAVALQELGIEISSQAIVEGLERVEIPGRMEVVNQNPLIILDGAHNSTETAALGRALDELLPGQPLTLLFASMSDKDLERMARELGPRADSVFLTINPGTERAADLRMLTSHFERHAPSVTAVVDPFDALREAVTATVRGALVICGSLYLVGALRSSLVREAASV
jgi:dihydrofolate synthase / folylpolyglutamate synthase